MSTTSPVRRRCGYRIEGGIYVEVPLSDYGQPLSYFLLDPAVPVGPEFGIPDRGMILRDNILFDRIGGDYPNVLDYLIETARFGVSRRIQSNFDFTQLNDETRYAIVHPRGYCLHEPAVRAQVVHEREDHGMNTQWLCPKSLHTAEHGIPDGKPCSGVWWHDIDERYAHDDEERETLIDARLCYRRPRHVEPAYLDAIIAVFPLVQLTVIKSRDGKSHLPALEKAHRAQGNIHVVVAES